MHDLDISEFLTKNKNSSKFKKEKKSRSRRMGTQKRITTATTCQHSDNSKMVPTGPNRGVAPDPEKAHAFAPWSSADAIEDTSVYATIDTKRVIFFYGEPYEVIDWYLDPRKTHKEWSSVYD